MRHFLLSGDLAEAKPNENKRKKSNASAAHAAGCMGGPFENADLLCLICAFVPLGGSRLLVSSRACAKMLPILFDALDGKAIFSTLRRAMVKTMMRDSRRIRCDIYGFRYHVCDIRGFRYHGTWSHEQLSPYLASAIAGGADTDLIYGLLCIQRSQQARQERWVREREDQDCDYESLVARGTPAVGVGTPVYEACRRDDAIVSLLLSFGACGHTVRGVQFVRDGAWGLRSMQHRVTAAGCGGALWTRIYCEAAFAAQGRSNGNQTNRVLSPA